VAARTTTRTYVYVGSGSERKLATESEPSVLQGGQPATTSQVFDVATGRLKATFRSGYTLEWNGAGWQVSPRTVGTFYFTHQPCTGGAADALGRVLEVHGPCLATSTAATDCQPSQGVVPVTQFTYWPSGSGADTGFMKSSTSYTQATDVAACAGASLLTQYAGYDAFGHASSVVDPNGVATTLAWSNGLLQSHTVDGKQTQYTYDNGELRSIRRPEGNHEVFCHRVSALGSGCPTTSAWSPLLQWKAKSADANGATWSEAVVYAWYADGRLKREEAWDGVSNTRRREASFDQDFRGNLAWQRLGTSDGMTAVATYDAVGALVAAPAAHLQNNSGAAVQSNGTVSANRNSAMRRDALSRLIAMDVPNGGATAASGDIARACYSWDTQSNLAQVRLGCQLGAGDTCASCATPATTYQHDDFGNLVQLTAPWMGTSGSPGTTRSAFDARNQLTRRATPAMAAAGEALVYAFDGASRPLQATHVRSGGSEVLWSNTWDAVNVALDCPQPSNTAGRVALREDTFGRTHYQYNARGLLVGEVRRRAGVTSCATAAPQDVPHTTYEYTDNGERRAVVMPLGRRVDYGFGVLGGVTTGRVESISIKMHDGAAWNSWTAISGARWEPYGGLRGYQGNPFGAGTAFGVEWVLGQNSNETVAGACPMAIPGPSGDFSGLTRGVWLSRGAWTAGAAASPLLQRLYVYFNRALVKQYSCYFNAVHPFALESYVLSSPGNLTQVSQQGPLGGNAVPRSWTTDARGNRLTQQTSYQVNAITLSTSPADRLTQFQLGAGTPVLSYDYDVDGRVTAIRQANDSSGQPSWMNQLAPASQGVTASGGLDSVYLRIPRIPITDSAVKPIADSTRSRSP
jgi:YD repeat-containing protein